MSNNTYSLTVKAVQANLEPVTDFIESNIPYANLRTSFCIAIDELFSNVVKFAYPDGEGDVSFTLTVTEKSVSLEIKDSGTQFNPLEHGDPDLSLAAEDRQIGGLGLVLVKNMMDEVGYTYSDNKYNVLTITKNVA